ncbi:MAG: flagellin [Desulfobacterales bacterium]|jgi:flagellin
MALNTISLTPGMRANLFSLQQTSKDFEIVQKRLATGLKINSALDDPINFFTAQEHRLRASDLAARKDGMSEAIQTIKAANVGVENINTLIAQAKSLAQSALSVSATTDAETFATQYSTVLQQINMMAQDSGYKGVNLLQEAQLTVQFASEADTSYLNLTGFGDTTSEFNVDGLDTEMAANLTTSNWVQAGDLTINTANVEASIDNLEEAMNELRVESKKLSSNLSIITAREEFTAQMINTLGDGASKLTEADMNEEGANMLMLQTRQALGTTSLSLASQAAQGVLRLF